MSFPTFMLVVIASLVFKLLANISFIYFVIAITHAAKIGVIQHKPILTFPISQQHRISAVLPKYRPQLKSNEVGADRRNDKQ